MSDIDDGDSLTGNQNIIDKATIDGANDLLNVLEQSHRSDLSLHLYSSYLLKHLLYKANEKKHWLEIDQFVRTQIKNNWTSWPSPKTVISPGTDLLYEDIVVAGQHERKQEQDYAQGTIKPGEVSHRALIHSKNMLRLELDSYWQHCFVQSSAKSGEVLDIDKMFIPKSVSDEVINKIDSLLSGLHSRMAQMNKIEIRQDQVSHNVTITQAQNETVKVKKIPKLTYRDIISQGCEMGEDMVEIYMKSLELYNDFPSKLKKNQYKLPKSVLRKYGPAKKGKSGIHKLMRSREQFLDVYKLLQDKRLSAQDKAALKKLSNSVTENAIDKKTFFKIKGFPTDEHTEDLYELDDCLAKVPT
ncbi:hypothetical protein HG535_0F00420 [Zygotorulaspora mrakii]|uniref:Rrn9 domain-containing protein n=1 Tax=Zygotorulaspora mrakii TaxID=42260 RepID=A0A7H9B6W3_ZYGMR|nr:uncharacterized protein HG535_0F00420 [Zygotorulaspora mrakii]QLG73532.1 hypothetical protein HG535_0F00420 [Zygotorulaspora mrakii]